MSLKRINVSFIQYLPVNSLVDIFLNMNVFQSYIQVAFNSLSTVRLDTSVIIKFLHAPLHASLQGANWCRMAVSPHHPPTIIFVSAELLSKFWTIDNGVTLKGVNKVNELRFCSLLKLQFKLQIYLPPQCCF